jgi:Tfp pilus assembly protein PilF
VRIQGVILNNLGDLLRRAGDLATAEEYLHQSLALARQYNERHYETVRLKNLGLILCAQGRDREAYQFFDEALAVAQQIDDQVTASEVRQQLEALAKRVGGETQVAADGE